MSQDQELKRTVRVTSFVRRDLSDLVRQNKTQLESSYVLVNKTKNEVVVKDGSEADLKFRDNENPVVPTGTQQIDGILYRTYMVPIVD
jgi:hypothetical protein